MNPLIVALGALITGCLLCIAMILGIVWMSNSAHAHSWYSGKTDPVFGGSCCGGSDCNKFAAIPDESITAEDDGYRIILTHEQAKTINPWATSGINALVTYDRVQPSEDGNWHICIMTSHRDNMRGGIYCLFSPPDT
jgi:hypothetical protein